MLSNILDKIERFQSKKIMVLGDLILDRYTIGTCDEISTESPTPIIKVMEQRYNPGGAGNAAVNLKTLGSNPYLIGIIGDDEEGEKLVQILEKYGIKNSGIFYSQNLRTVFKERIMARGQHVVRVDHCDKIENNQEHYDFLFAQFQQNLDSVDIVVISDYAKGTLSEELIKNIINKCKDNKKWLIVDPRPKHTLAYRQSSFITPNFEEACGMVRKLDPQRLSHSGRSLDEARIISSILSERLESKIISTLSELGMFYCDFANKCSEHFPTYKREVRDVSGAGDTVVAALAVGLSNDLTISEAIYFANHAAGVAVEKSGVQPVSLEEAVRDIILHNTNQKK